MFNYLGAYLVATELQLNNFNQAISQFRTIMVFVVCKHRIIQIKTVTQFLKWGCLFYLAQTFADITTKANNILQDENTWSVTGPEMLLSNCSNQLEAVR